MIKHVTNTRTLPFWLYSRFMIPGPFEDDRYRMVEDEFLQTAQQFTVHLHRTEYDRLKALAKSQNATAISEIEKPVISGPMTWTAKRHQADLERAKKQRRVTNAGGSGRRGEEQQPPPPELPSLRGTGLLGLLESPRKEARGIMGSYESTTMPKTRAAAGFRSGSIRRSVAGSGAERGSRQDGVLIELKSQRQRHMSDPDRSQVDKDSDDSVDDEDNDDENDLAGPPQSTALLQNRTRERERRRQQQQTGLVASIAHRSSRLKPASAAATTTAKLLADAVAVGDDEYEEDDPFGITKRMIQRKRSREQVRKTLEARPVRQVDQDTIPSFL